jgi:hypothetical protein
VVRKQQGIYHLSFSTSHFSFGHSSGTNFVSVCVIWWIVFCLSAPHDPRNHREPTRTELIS